MEFPRKHLKIMVCIMCYYLFFFKFCDTISEQPIREMPINKSLNFDKRQNYTWLLRCGISDRFNIKTKSNVQK